MADSHFVTAAMADVSAAAAEALTKATDALHLASQAMSRAAKVYHDSPQDLPSPRSDQADKETERYSSYSQQRFSYINDSTSVLIPDHYSSIEKPARATLKQSPQEHPYNSSETKHDLSSPDRKHFSGRGFNYVDILEATTRSRDFSYGEAVADRNIDSSVYHFEADTEALSPLTDSFRHRHQISLEHVEAEIDQHGVVMSLPREIGFLIVVCLAQICTFVALSQTIAPLPFLVESFPAPPRETWYSAAYALTLGTFILPSGRFGDVFGHKKLFVIGWAYFSIFSICCGLAQIWARGAQTVSGRSQAETYFIVMRALQGVGPAVLLPNAMALLGRVYKQGNKKNMVFALFGWCAPLGFVSGSTLSALISTRVPWGWMFSILGIACAIIAAVSLLVVPVLPAHQGQVSHSIGSSTEKRRGPFSTRLSSHHVSWRERCLQIDIVGSLLGVTALILLNISLNQAPLVGWAMQYTYFLLILSIIFFVLFLLSQSPRRNQHPLLPLDVMDTSTILVLVCTLLGWSAFGIWIFYSFSYLLSSADGPSLTPLVSAAWFSPAPISGLFASAATGLLLSKLHPRWIMLFSMIAFFIGTTIISTVGSSSPNTSAKTYFTGIFWSIVIMPWGMDMSFPSATILLSNSVGEKRQGVAASLVNTVVNYGISLGLGIAGTVVRYATRSGEQDAGAPERVVDCRHAWYAAMGLSGLGVLVASVFVGIGLLETRRLRR